jgi:hypothetical protein
MRSLGRCMDIVPAEGYTQRRTSPSNTNHPERTRKVSTASTAEVEPETKDPQSDVFSSGRHSWRRSVVVQPRAMTAVNTDRKISCK